MRVPSGVRQSHKNRSVLRTDGIPGDDSSAPERIVAIPLVVVVVKPEYGRDGVVVHHAFAGGIKIRMVRESVIGRVGPHACIEVLEQLISLLEPGLALSAEEIVFDGGQSTRVGRRRQWSNSSAEELRTLNGQTALVERQEGGHRAGAAFFGGDDGSHMRCFGHKRRV